LVVDNFVFSREEFILDIALSQSIEKKIRFDEGEPCMEAIPWIL